MDNEPTKAEIATKILRLREDIKRVEIYSAEERRKMGKDFDRRIREIKVLVVGNKKDIKQLWKRSSDNTDDIEKLQDALNTVFKIFVTTVIGVIVTVIFKEFFDLF